jgi:hypothetical protein
MSLKDKLITADQPMKVENVNIVIYGDPGIGKTSLGFTASKPILLDFDKGAQRSANRKETLEIDSWDTVLELINPANKEAKELISPYQTIVIDTVGQALDMLSDYIVKHNPNLHSETTGGLKIQGFGRLKSDFRNFMKSIRAMGKDVVMLAHSKEQRYLTKNEQPVMKPEITGSSYSMIFKVSDLVAYYSSDGNNRILDFRPIETHEGKDSANLGKMIVPMFGGGDSDFLASQVIKPAKDALGSASEEFRQAQLLIDQFRERITNCEQPNELAGIVWELASGDYKEYLRAQVKPIIKDKAAMEGWEWNNEIKGYDYSAEALEQKQLESTSQAASSQQATSQDNNSGSVFGNDLEAEKEAQSESQKKSS